MPQAEEESDEEHHVEHHRDGVVQRGHDLLDAREEAQRAREQPEARVARA